MADRGIPVVRWLGAFRRTTDLSDAVDWELRAERMVACEALVYRKSRMPLGTRLGLLVDQAKSELVRAYSCDVWSEPEGSELCRASKRFIRKRHGKFRVAHTWDELPTLRDFVPKYGHTEAWVRSQSYLGLVIRPGSWKPAARQAIQLSQQFGIPIVDFHGRELDPELLLARAPNPPRQKSSGEFAWVIQVDSQSTPSPEVTDSRVHLRRMGYRLPPLKPGGGLSNWYGFYYTRREAKQVIGDIRNLSLYGDGPEIVADRLVRADRIGCDWGGRYVVLYRIVW